MTPPMAAAIPSTIQAAPNHQNCRAKVSCFLGFHTQGNDCISHIHLLHIKDAINRPAYLVIAS
jgi:hypothetical protein